MDIAFLVLASLWTMGQGMHLSANSINNLLGPGDTPVHELVHFYDEVLSHYLWHIGLVGLSILLLIPPRSGQAETARRTVAPGDRVRVALRLHLFRRVYRGRHRTASGFPPPH